MTKIFDDLFVDFSHNDVFSDIFDKNEHNDVFFNDENDDKLIEIFFVIDIDNVVIIDLIFDFERVTTLNAVNTRLLTQTFDISTKSKNVLDL